MDNTRTLNARWYTGSGIYRDVKLMVGEQHHIQPEGVRITTVSIEPPTIRVKVATSSNDEADSVTHIKRDGEIMARGRGKSCEIVIPDGRLWSAETLHLSDVETLLQSGER